MRSDFLTHWTGKDIGVDPHRLDDAQRERYVERVLNTVAAGLWMSSLNETLVSTVGDQPVHVFTRVPVTCFTELRLSGSRPHFSQYGLVGLVFTREFILERGGGPVMYVAQRDGEPLVANLAQLQHWLAQQRDGAVHGAADMMHGMFYLLAFMKGMSNPNANDYAYLDEHEWRIVHSDFQTATGRLVPTHVENPPYRIPFCATDLKMLILPDDGVRREIVSASRFLEWSGDVGLPVLTVTEIEQF